MQRSYSLKCTSTYPAKAHNSNLNTIPHLKELYKCQVGLSDHTLGVGTAIAATALGATVIENILPYLGQMEELIVLSQWNLMK